MSIPNKNIDISTVMLPVTDFPIVAENIILKEVLEKMDVFRLGIACIVNRESKLRGIITDGDIRRKILSIQRPLSAFFIDDAINQAIKNPITASIDMSLPEAVDLMEKNLIWDLPVVDSGKLVGLLHLHSVVKVLLSK